MVTYIVPYDGHSGGRRVGCVCDCGSTIETAFTDLARRKNPVCLCKRRWTDDLVGKKFGELKVLSEARMARRGNRAQKIVLCECSCGKEIEVETRRLLTKKHCGCKKLDPLTASYRQLIHSYIHQANQRGHLWDLDEDQCIAFFSQDCYYCGVEPYRQYNYEHGESFLYNGLDRVDNDEGYTEENIVPCCRECNIAKGAMPIDEWWAYIERLSEHYLKRIGVQGCLNTISPVRNAA